MKKARKRYRSHRMFGLPTQEATQPLAMPLLQVDIDKAEKIRAKNPSDKSNFLACAVAQATIRALGAERVAIEREVAYVAFPGEQHTKRYLVDAKSREVLEKFDQGEELTEGVELRLKPPRKSHTKAALRQKNRKWHRENPDAYKDKSARKTKRQQRPTKKIEPVIRNGNLVRWS